MGLHRRGNGKLETEDRAAGSVRRTTERSFVLGGDVGGDGEPEAGSVFLGGKEGLEDTFASLRRDTVAFIADLD
jgi:hypothetical protein